MNKDEFYLYINALIEKYNSLSKDDANNIGVIIRNEIRKRKYAKLKHSGPCMLCSKQIDYKFISIAHGTQGDEFLERLKAKMAMFVFKIETDYNHNHYKKLVNYAEKNIEPYFCDDCFSTMKTIMTSEWPIVKVPEQKKPDREEYDHDRYIKYLISFFGNSLVDEYDNAIAARLSLIKNKFQMIRTVYTQADYNLLSSMNYLSFLKTTYWKIIRDHILDINSSVCVICNSNHRLNVHHKSYQNHGREHEHLEDLTVLCKNCHSKFHDKLGVINQRQLRSG